MADSEGRRVFLSPPDMGRDERALLLEAFDSNWIAPLGPHVDAFEQEFAEAVGAADAAALSSGTAALHLALELCGVGVGSEVFVSTLTFAASVFPIRYLGAEPVLIDSELRSWNMDPDLVAEALRERAAVGRLPKAIVAVHLYGQSADMRELVQIAAEFDVPVIEDAAEALGATCNGRPAGSIGRFGIFSFNGNKIITTSGGGMLVSDDGDAIVHARKLASQAREPEVHYEHASIGYNYRMSNLLAAVGRGQLRTLGAKVEARRSNFDRYQDGLGDLSGVAFMPEAPWGRHSRWLTTLTIDPGKFGADREEVRLALEAENIEARPVWKPMHLQPVFAGARCYGGGVSELLFRDGLCLPSGSDLSAQDQERVVDVVRRTARAESVRRTGR